jgi:hypothetical protein
MAALFGASIAGRIATGPNAGQHVRVAGNAIEDRYLESLTGPRCANVAGFSLHANVAVRASDRHGLERLCGYTGRGPLATERLTRRPDGRLAYRLKRPWSNLATHVIFNRPELLEKLAGCDEAARGCRAAQAKEPGFGAEPRQSDGPASPISHGPLSRTLHDRYHGVLAPSAKWRSQIVPCPPEGDAADEFCPHSGADGPTGSESTPRGPNTTWSRLLGRVFQIDVLECPRR